MTNLNRHPMCILMLLFSAFLTFSSIAYAADRHGARSLKGLTGLNVLIGSIPDRIKNRGFNTELIQNDTELKLRMAGIDVISEEEAYERPGRPYLYVNTHVESPKILNGLSVFTVSVTLNQQVVLLRDTTDIHQTATWILAEGGIVGTENIGAIRDKIKDMLDIFIKDYLTVNPRRGKITS